MKTVSALSAIVRNSEYVLYSFPIDGGGGGGARSTGGASGVQVL